MATIRFCENCGIQIYDDEYRMSFIHETDKGETIKTFEICKSCFDNLTRSYELSRKSLASKALKGLGNG